VSIIVIPTLRVFPSEDVAFRFVGETFDALCTEAPTRDHDPMDPEQLQWRLRERYPAAIVRRRDPLADPDAGDVVWYVYRFGSVAPGRRWWEEPGHAWAVFDDDRRFVEVATSLTEIVEAPREALIGRPIEAFSNPEDVSVPEDVEALWDELRRRGQLHATLRFRRLDGTPRQIEYHVTRDGAGPGRHLAVVREIDPR
jgi:PAS domain-containing protein